MGTSKFKGILDRAKEREPEDPENAAPPSPAPVVAAARKPGRPAGGKRSDADYVQTTAYIHKNTHRDVKIALLKSGDDMDFSELVDSLLITWLQSRS